MHLRSHNKQNVIHDPVTHHNTHHVNTHGTNPLNTHGTHHVNTHGTQPLGTHGTHGVNTHGTTTYVEPGVNHSTHAKPSKIGGKMDKVKGNVKESVGRMLNKPEIAVSGTQDKLKGDAKVANARYNRTSIV